MNNVYILLYLVSFLLIVALVACIYLLYKFKHQKFLSDENSKIIINTINSIRYGNLAARLIIDKDNKFPVLSESINKMVETIQDREKMIQEFKKEIVGHNVFLETLINSLSEGFLILNDNMIIQKMTSVCEKLLGKQAEGKPLDLFIDLPKELDISKRLSFESSLKSDVNIHLLVILSQLDFSDNEEFKYLLTIKDVSKEQELKQIRNDFVATLAHDLRVPLLAESNTLKLIKNGSFGELDEKIMNVMNLLQQSNDDVLLLTDVLLETYKIEQTDFILKKQVTSINHLIREVCDEMFGIAAFNSMSINLNLSDDFDAFIDVFYMKRVLRNLINNSLDYSSNTSDKIDIYTRKIDNECCITIRDYGVGITQEEKEHIFQKFYSGAHKFRKVGSGLGLYLANEIIKKHGGKIVINSEPNKKTDFEIFLPL